MVGDFILSADYNTTLRWLRPAPSLARFARSDGRALVPCRFVAASACAFQSVAMFRPKGLRWRQTSGPRLTHPLRTPSPRPRSLAVSPRIIALWQPIALPPSRFARSDRCPLPARSDGRARALPLVAASPALVCRHVRPRVRWRHTVTIHRFALPPALLALSHLSSPMGTHGRRVSLRLSVCRHLRPTGLRWRQTSGPTADATTTLRCPSPCALTMRLARIVPVSRPCTQPISPRSR